MELKKVTGWIIIGVLLQMLVARPGLAGDMYVPRTLDEKLEESLGIVYRQHYQWGIFLGAGTTPEQLRKFAEEIEAKRITNPFTRRPFDDVKIFAFGKDNPLLEGLRLVTDHLELHVLSSASELRDYRFDHAICHSNGCTYSIDAHREGLMRMDNIYAMGTDYFTKDFSPGELRGANLTFFVAKGDSIPRIPALNWERVTEETPGFGITIRGNSPGEIARGFGRLFTGGRGDGGTFPVVRLDPPGGQRATITQPFKPHALENSYFKAVGEWMDRRGTMQNELRSRIDSTRAFAPPNVTPPRQRPLSGTDRSLPNQPLRQRSNVDARGGISADITIDSRDFKNR